MRRRCWRRRDDKVKFSVVDPEQINNGEAPSRPGSKRPAPGPRGGHVRPPQPDPTLAEPAATEARGEEPRVDDRRARPHEADSPQPRHSAETPPGPRGHYRSEDWRYPPPHPGPVPTNIYRARRPAVAMLLVIPAVAAGVLLVKALAMAGFGDSFNPAGVVASSLALASLPLLVAGLYGLITGAAHGAEHWGFRVWARPPLAYLLVGIAFIVAAAIAVPIPTITP